jgi:transcription antitermination protein NusB
MTDANPQPDFSANQPAAPARLPARRVHPSAGRRAARVLALETLFETDLAGHRPAEVLARRSDEVPRDPLVAEYARELLAGVLQHRRELDDIIQQRATAYPVAQLAAIDRNILRLGLYEVVYRNATVPVSVAINEAVELAKLYGGESAARFVNGVLGRVADHSQPDQALLGEPPASQDPNS